MDTGVSDNHTVDEPDDNADNQSEEYRDRDRNAVPLHGNNSDNARKRDQGAAGQVDTAEHNRHHDADCEERIGRDGAQDVQKVRGGEEVIRCETEDYKQNKETDEDTDIRFEEADDRPEDNVVLIPVEQFFFHLTAS